MTTPETPRGAGRGDLERALRLVAPVVGLAVLSACGGVKIRPEPALPKALVEPIPAKVGIVVPDEMKKFSHKETRWGVDWQVDLGGGHEHLVHDLFKSAFTELDEGDSLDKVKLTPGLKAIFEPRIEQYSFATARETGGRYYAVTIRYRVDLYTPAGEKADSYTLTGYGNALAKGVSSGRPLKRASEAAMRDAAAKFLVQFPEQPAGKRLVLNQAVEAEKAQVAQTGINEIEVVPIDEPSPVEAALSPPTPPPDPAKPDSTPPGDLEKKDT
jgi:hypothetical protein